MAIRSTYLLEFHNGPTRNTVPLDRIRESLQDGDRILNTRRGLNLRPLKKAASLLPNYAPLDEDTLALLEEMFAIIFHTSGVVTRHLTKKFFLDHPEPIRAKGVSASRTPRARPTLDSLLEF